MNSIYARMSDFKAEAGGVIHTEDDTSWLRALERASREVDSWCGQRFYPETATAYFDGSGIARLMLHLAANEQFRSRVQTVTTLKADSTGDGTYDVTFTEATHFWRRRKHVGGGHSVLEINPYAPPALTTFPDAPLSVELVGVFGAWTGTVASAATVDDAGAIDTSQITITVDDGHQVEVGDTLNENSEDMLVTEVAPTRLTVDRAINGTTGSTHANDVALARRTYPSDVAGVVTKMALRAQWDSQGGMDQSATPEWLPKDRMYLQLREAIDRWKVVGQ